MTKESIFDGRKLRVLRKRARLSQAQLAKRVGVTQGFIWQVEEGRKTPSLRVLTRIASELNVSLEELLRVVNASRPGQCGGTHA